MAKKVMAKGPSEMKGQKVGKAFGKLKGPSEMYAAGAAGPKHKGIKGPGEMMEAKLGGKSGKLPIPALQSQGGLKPYGLDDSMAKLGHKKLEAMTPKKLGMHHSAGEDDGGDSEG